ncbi:hypothetical protein GE061_008254 [Apolygus lucorum]|uniref:Uncharacterized protein n=1 Tax=Apolygus lucorum TaxID=248454 RepID=A0A6A4IUE6_APOLU|nr:hypothetical protein GE061_008254 [Apolygus lucorum]
MTKKKIVLGQTRRFYALLFCNFTLCQFDEKRGLACCEAAKSSCDQQMELFFQVHSYITLSAEILHKSRIYGKHYM